MSPFLFSLLMKFDIVLKALAKRLVSKHVDLKTKETKCFNITAMKCTLSNTQTHGNRLRGYRINRFIFVTVAYFLYAILLTIKSFLFYSPASSFQRPLFTFNASAYTIKWQLVEKVKQVLRERYSQQTSPAKNCFVGRI